MKSFTIYENIRTFCIGNARTSFSLSSFFAINDFCIIKPASMYFLLDQIYKKRPLSSYITLFFLKKTKQNKQTLFQPVVHWIILKKISKLLLFQLKENEFSALEMLRGYKRLLKIRINFSMKL